MPSKIALRGKDELIAALKQHRIDVEQGMMEVLKKSGRAGVRAIRAELVNAPNSMTHAKAGDPPLVQFSREKRNGTEPRKGKPRRGGLTEVELRRDAIRFHLAPPLLGKPLSLRMSIRFPGANAFYAHMLEYGTSKMQPRPFYHRIMDGMESVIEAKADKVLEKAAGRFAQ